MLSGGFSRLLGIAVIKSNYIGQSSILVRFKEKKAHEKFGRPEKPSVAQHILKG